MKEKKKLSILLVLILLIYPLITTTKVKAASETVNIKDEILRSVIIEALNKPNDYAITKEDMNSIESLSYSGNSSEKITDLSGLELCSNLKELSLPYNEISDLSPLSNLTNLSELALDHNEISYLMPLEKLTNLKELTLSDNCITYIRPLLKLADNLVYINLENQKINLSIDEVDEFKEFDMSNCYDLLDTDYLFDNDLIGENPELTSLSSSDPSAKSYRFKYPLNCFNIPDPGVMSTNDFSGFITVTCKNISEPVDIPDENLRDCILDALNKNSSYTITKKDLESLTSLKCNNCSINDISGLEYCTNLKELDLTSNNISDLSPLSSLKDKIENLFITYQNIELEKKSSYGTVTIKNPITGYDNKPLKPRKISNDGIYSEEDNTITWNNLTEDISKLTINYSDGEAAYYDSLNSTSAVPLPGIPTGYSCTVTLPVNVINPDTPPILIEDNKLKAALLDTLGKDSDYTIVKKDMETITSLDLSNKGIKNISGLEFCRNLKTINLNNNKITDISPLSKLKNLEKADVEGNRITDISCLYKATNKLSCYNITNQYIALNFVSCDGSYSMQNVIKDMPKACITEISNGGKYIDSLDIINWNNLKKNTTVSYSYSKTLSEKEAKELNAPLINYSCKVNRYIKVTSAE